MSYNALILLPITLLSFFLIKEALKRYSERARTLGGPEPDPRAAEPRFEVTGIAARHPSRHPNDDFVQPRARYEKVMTDVDRDRLIRHIVDHLSGAKNVLQLRQTTLFYKVHTDHGAKVAKGLGLDIEEVKQGPN